MPKPPGMKRTAMEKVPKVKFPEVELDLKIIAEEGNMSRQGPHVMLVNSQVATSVGRRAQLSPAMKANDAIMNDVRELPQTKSTKGMEGTVFHFRSYYK